MRVYIVIAFVLVGGNILAQSARNLVRSGNENYFTDSLSRAVENYEKAMNLDPNLEEAKFNLGDAFYKQGKYADAAGVFHDLGDHTTNRELKSEAYFNEGNAHMSMQKYDAAMNAYKNALKTDPSNQNARYNYEYARKMLEKQKEQENKDEDKNEDKDKDEDKDNNKDQNKDKDKDKDQEKDQDKKEDKDQNKDKNEDKNEDKNKDQDQNKDQEKKDEEGKNGDQPQQNEQPQGGQMSKQDAERLLKAMEENEKKTREKVALQKAKATSKTKSEKQW
jgi:tetratricopeptide (TPR) repeat protein